MPLEELFLVRISSWDCGFHVGVATAATPREQRFLGGLIYSRSLDIEGEILAPAIHQGKLLRASFVAVRSSPESGDEDLYEAGQLYEHLDGSRGADFTAVAILPEDALAPAVTCMASAWAFVELSTTGAPREGAAITDFAFSRNAPRAVSGSAPN